MTAPNQPPERLDLSLRPSPLHTLPRLAEHLGLRAPLLVKRDDLLGRGLGGNKLRKLERILPVALARGDDCLLTTGSFESNHCCVTTVVAGMLGLHTALVLMGSEGDRVPTFNERLERQLGAVIRTVIYTPETRGQLSERVEAAVAELTAELESEGRKVFRVPGGGCCLEGNLSFVDAFGELQAQMTARGHATFDIVIAVGTGSSFAGLAAGVLKSEADVRLRGVSIARCNPRCAEETYKSLQRACEHLDLSTPPADALDISDDQVGEGYAVPTEQSLEAAALAAETEGLLLDQTYTGKALAGLIAWARTRDNADHPIVFWHTGGLSGAVDDLMIHAS